MVDQYPMDPDSLEALWRDVAAALAEVGPENEAMYLAKLVMLLIGQRSDVEGVRRCVEAAKLNLSTSKEVHHGQ